MTVHSAGPALGEAAVHAETAFRALVRMTLVLDAGGMAVADEVAEVIEDVADISAGILQLADDHGHGEVARRRHGGRAA